MCFLKETKINQRHSVYKKDIAKDRKRLSFIYIIDTEHVFLLINQ